MFFWYVELIYDDNRGPARENGCVCHMANKHKIVYGLLWNQLAKILIKKKLSSKFKVLLYFFVWEMNRNRLVFFFLIPRIINATKLKKKINPLKRNFDLLSIDMQHNFVHFILIGCTACKNLKYITRQ